MLFTSPLFLFFFLSVYGGFLLLRRCGSARLANGFLLTASLVFYASWEFPKGLIFLPLLVGTSLLDWWAGRLMYVLPRRDSRRNWLLLLSLVLNLGSLAVFKYLGFFATTLNDLAGLLGSGWAVAVPRLILPLGISFFTFQSMSYTIDAYRRRGRPYRSAFDFLFFVTFFPQLIAGPIVRAEQFRGELLAHRDTGAAAFVEGFKLATVGFFLKAVMADNVAIRIDRLYGSLEALTPVDALVAYYGFGLQIFCDFAGYSLIAVGLARVFGFRLPRNFDVPYLAIGFRDFWRRWHMTLSTWLRDYLYIPLGGSRKGVSRTAAALALTMLFGGLWHGASWNFVIWGAAHGLLLALGRVTRSVVPGLYHWQESTKPGRLITWFLTLHVVLLLWIPFRAPDMADTARMIELLAGLPGVIGSTGNIMHQEAMLVLPFLAGLIVYHVLALAGRRDGGQVHRTGPVRHEYVLPEDRLVRLGPLASGLILGVLWVVIELFYVGEVSFIYFAF